MLDTNMVLFLYSNMSFELNKKKRSFNDLCL